ncbi:MAG: NAD-dependent epimerase/dehydratase family protein [Acetobacteraceae bacterium]
MSPPARVALVGAGFIARAHAVALRRTEGVRIAAVIDPAAAAGQALARAEGATHFAALEAALAAGGFDRAHVLVPPDRHAAIAETLLRAGKPVLVEKPLAADSAAAAALVACAGPTPLGVNQNFVHHPAFLRLRGWLDAGRLGPLRSVDVLYNVGLRQLAGRQFGHWMFRRPVNLLLEQAVHPLSQLLALTGELELTAASFGPALEIGPGQALFPTLTALLDASGRPASLRFAVGQAFPVWQLRVVCDDGVAVADMLANRAYAVPRSRWMDAVDAPLAGVLVAGRILGDSVGNLSAYARGLLRLGGPGDPFQASMTGSIRAFHRAVGGGASPALDGAFGLRLVALCEALAARAPAVAPAPPSPEPDPGPADIALLGGTGFIGTHLLRACLAAGLRVVVMARNLGGLPAAFHHPRVRRVRGDIRDGAAVAAAIAGVPVVVNLAHGGGGADYAAIRAAMVGGAETVARACLEAGSRRLIHVGSIAALYLGPGQSPITGATPPDPRAEERGDYARAKAEADRALLALHASARLPLVILRPGVVVGEGTSPFHSGVGLFNNDQHCIGWNDGRNPLPFVLAGDVAAAILAAATASGIEGRCYNLAGDVRPCARDYIAELARALRRPLRFHPQSPERLWLVELGKWMVKRAGGRRPPWPSLRDLRSRGMAARFDCADAQRDLGWVPVADPAVFHAQAIAPHVG